MFLPPLSMSIDLITLAYSKIKSRKRCKNALEDISKPLAPLEKKVSVFIPSFNEGEKLRSTVDCILNQTYTPQDIYILDDISTDSTVKVCKDLEKKYGNVYHVRRNKKLGKAGNINALVKEKAEELGDYVLVVDGDVKLEKNCLEELVKSSDGAAIVTGFGYTKEPTARIAKILHEGESWINSVFSFRKKAQDIRKAIFVICGALSLYDKNILKEIPIPERTLTEDTDYTWLVQEKGHKVEYTDKARAVGNNPNSFRGYWRRYKRWFSGTFQGLYTHGRELNKSKSLLYSTILPGCIESVPYSITFSSLPALACVYPEVAEGVLAADLILSAPFLFFHPKGFRHAVFHLPHIYAYKYFGSVACLYAGVKTSLEKILGQTYKWNNSWANSSQAEINMGNLNKKYMKKKFSDFMYLEKEWANLGEKAWNKDNFFYKLPKKWKLSTYASSNEKPVGYAIVSQPDKKKKEAFLHKILVDNDYQGLRIGSRLFVNTAYKCKQAGMEKLNFKVGTDNKAAIALYRKYGVSINTNNPVMCSDNVERYECELRLG